MTNVTFAPGDEGVEASIVTRLANNAREEAALFRFIDTMIVGGLTLREALGLIAQESEGPLKKLVESLDAGIRFPLAIGAFRESFSPSALAILGYQVCENEVLMRQFAKAAAHLSRIADMAMDGASLSEIRAMAFFSLVGILRGQGYPTITAVELAGKEYLPQGMSERLVQALLEGSTLAGACLAEGAHFSAVDCVMMALSESTGNGPDIFEHVAVIKEREFYYTKRNGEVLDSEAIYTLQEYMCLYYLLTYGHPILYCVTFIAKHSLSLERRTVYGALGRRLENSETFSTILESMPDDFAPPIVALIKIGEEKDELDEAFALIMEYAQRELLGIEHSFSFL